jgi:hypothetical protein
MCRRGGSVVMRGPASSVDEHPVDPDVELGAQALQQSESATVLTCDLPMTHAEIRLHVKAILQKLKAKKLAQAARLHTF